VDRKMTEIEKALVKESVYRHYCLRYARAKKMMEFYEVEMLRLRAELNGSSGSGRSEDDGANPAFMVMLNPPKSPWSW
jgi:hypothetical protein